MIKTRVPSAATGGSYTRLAAMRSAGSAVATDRERGAARALAVDRLAVADGLRTTRVSDDADCVRDADRVRRADRGLAVGGRRRERVRDAARRVLRITPSAPRDRAGRPRRRPPGWWR